MKIRNASSLCLEIIRKIVIKRIRMIRKIAHQLIISKKLKLEF